MNNPDHQMQSNLPNASIFKKPEAVFISIILLSCLFIFLISHPGSRPFLYQIDVMTAKLFAVLAKCLGFNVFADGIRIDVTFKGTTRALLIGFGCDGVEAYLILASAIIPFPCHLRAKIMGLTVGLLFVLLINQIRLASLVVVLFILKDANDFGFYHTVVGQIFALTMIVIFWSRWAAGILSTTKARKTVSSE
jgi:exosortase/archaeosortase family protein